jgi:hypothetical protein
MQMRRMLGICLIMLGVLAAGTMLRAQSESTTKAPT